MDLSPFAAHDTTASQVVEHGKAFCERYDLGIRVETGWGEPSIVRATIDSFRAILAKDDEIGCGFCVPVLPPSALFKTRRAESAGKQCVITPFSTVISSTKVWAKHPSKTGKCFLHYL
jgi:hypothetical protein